MSTGYRVPATGNALGITTDCPGTTKKCAENTCTEVTCHTPGTLTYDLGAYLTLPTALRGFSL